MADNIRQYTVDDWSSLLEMYCTFEPKGVYMGLPPWQAEQTEGWLRGLLQDERNTHFILLTGPRVIGHAVLVYYPNIPYSREIIIFVHQAHQRRGLGRRMFVAALDWADNHREIDEVWLYVDWHNAHARRLYTSVGFTGHPPSMRDSETLMRRTRRS